MICINDLKKYLAVLGPLNAPAMMRPINTIGYRLWPKINALAVCLAWLMVARWCVLPAVAQPATEQPSSEPLAVAPVVDWSDALRLHRVIERWVRQGGIDPQSAEPAMPVTGALGVRVTLRWSGITMGLGDALPAPARQAQGNGNVDNAPGQPVDLVRLARSATRQALRAVNEKLIDMHGRAISAGTAATDSQPLSVQDAGPRLQIDLQIAHRSRFIVLAENEPARALYRQFVPGYHGLRLKRPAIGKGGVETVWMWPANALAANMSPRSQFVRMLTDLGYRADDLKSVARPSGLQLSTFEVIHIVQPGNGLPAMRLIRGNEVLPPTSLSSQSLDAMARRLTSFLVRRKLADGRLAGTYHPSTDRYDPEIAPMYDAALVVFVLSRRGDYLSRSDPNDPQLLQTVDAIHALATRLVEVFKATDDKNLSVGRMAATALMVMAVESPHLARYKRHRDEWAEVLMRMRRDDGSFQATVADQAKPLNRPTQALVVAALASLYEQTRDERLARSVTQSLDWLCQDADASALINMLPWLAMAQSRMARLGILETDGAAVPAGQTPNVAAKLTQLAQTLRKKQVSARNAGEVLDVVGGFDLAANSTGTTPDPNWRSAYILAFLASTLNPPGAAGHADNVNVVECLLACGLAGRFLAQLMFDEPGCYYVRNRDDAIGGVRWTLWDNRLSNGPAAMTLLAVTELQNSVAQLRPLDETQSR